MAKLPKKTTIVDTIGRVKRYAITGAEQGKITFNFMTSILEDLNKLSKQLVK